MSMFDPPPMVTQRVSGTRVIGIVLANTTTAARLVFGAGALRTLHEVASSNAARDEEYEALAMIVAGVLGTDFIDGQIARRMGATTKFGATFDTVTDKAVVVTLMAILHRNGLIHRNRQVSAALVGAMTIRELLMVIMKQAVKSRYGVDMKVKQSGRIKMLAQSAALVAAIHPRTRGWASEALFTIAAVLTIVSLIPYGKELRTVMHTV